jgi:hypothetical protein
MNESADRFDPGLLGLKALTWRSNQDAWGVRQPKRCKQLASNRCPGLHTIYGLTAGDNQKG